MGSPTAKASGGTSAPELWRWQSDMDVARGVMVWCAWTVIGRARCAVCVLVRVSLSLALRSDWIRRFPTWRVSHDSARRVPSKQRQTGFINRPRKLVYTERKSPEMAAPALVEPCARPLPLGSCGTR